ncbi:NAD(P)-binding protein [Aulographum hederae CBS 113979]|uniref:NAD(P)-binding protein n=1 Tax=Aulographum hederae CBS 113979 TaxID=1176131 RepID=A0A6G1GR36_9PEZI|nr:NAD(P)-binding protein [Aulographum hederae CBS 113979]
MSSLLQKFLLGLGATTLLYNLALLLRFVRLHSRPSSLPRYLSQSPATWALVTGASDGIGAGFAHELLVSGFNVILHGRNPTKLATLRDQLAAQYPSREIDTVVGDGTKVAEAIENVENFIKEKGYVITILINNLGGVVGLGPTHFPIVGEMDGDHLDRILDLNARFMMQMCRAVMPLMGKSSKGDASTNPLPSLIINIGSVLGVAALPFLTAYAGCKALTLTWSRALAAEQKQLGRDVEVLGIIVGNVQSAMNTSDVTFWTPSSRQMARAALNKIGCGQKVVVGYWPHAVQMLPVMTMPEWLKDRILGKTMKDSYEEEQKKLKAQ